MARPAETGSFDRETFTAWFRQYHPYLVNYAWRITRDVQAAEDAVQDVFLRLWGMRDNFQFAATISAYLYRGVHNRAITLKRQSRHNVAIDMVIDMASELPDDAKAVSGRDDVRLILERAIGQLPEQSRLVFSLLRNLEVDAVPAR